MTLIPAHYGAVIGRAELILDQGKFLIKQGKHCFQRWNRCVRFKVVRLSSLIPWDLRHAEQLLFLCPCSNLTVYRRLFFAHPLCASLSCLQYGISFGNKKPDNVDRYYRTDPNSRLFSNSSLSHIEAYF